MNTRFLDGSAAFLVHVHGWSTLDDLWSYATRTAPKPKDAPDAVVLRRDSKQLLVWRPAPGRLCARGDLDLEHPPGHDWAHPDAPMRADAGTEGPVWSGPAIVQWVNLNSMENPTQARIVGHSNAPSLTVHPWPIFEDGDALTEALLDVVHRRYFPRCAKAGMERIGANEDGTAFVLQAPKLQGGGWRTYIEERDNYYYIEDPTTRQPTSYADREAAVAAANAYLRGR